ncbi:MAG: carboxypeptidase regulatory-like domain-containing protein [Planctomycetota bacterium]
MSLTGRKLVLLASLLLFLVGCGPGGPELADVTGKVTLDGNPLPSARVEFSPVDEGLSSSSAITDSSGNYVLGFSRDRKGAMPGKYRVQITTYRNETDSSGKTVTLPERVPPMYNSQTELEREVVSGKNEFNFPLTGEIKGGAKGKKR